MEGREAHRVYQTVCEMWREHLSLPVEAVALSPEEFFAIYEDQADRWGGFHAAPLGWYPGYTDPEYFLRLLFHSESVDNAGGFSTPDFDDLVERARRGHDEKTRLSLFHQADRLAVADVVAAIPLTYTSHIVLSKPWVHGWWELGKSWSSIADLRVGSRA